MTWRRGFFRVWVLLTTLWAAVVFAFTVGSLIEPWVPARGYYFRAGEPFPFERYSTDHTNLERLREADKILAVSLDELPGTTLYLKRDIDANERDKRIDKVFEIESAYRAEQIAAKRLEGAQSAMAIILVPSATILLLGLGVAWAVAGFKPGRGRPD